MGFLLLTECLRFRPGGVAPWLCRLLRLSVELAFSGALQLDVCSLFVRGLVAAADINIGWTDNCIVVALWRPSPMALPPGRAAGGLAPWRY